MTETPKIPQKWAVVYPKLVAAISEEALTGKIPVGSTILRQNTTYAERIAECISEDNSFKGFARTEQGNQIREAWLLGVFEGKARTQSYWQAMEVGAQKAS